MATAMMMMRPGPLGSTAAETASRVRMAAVQNPMMQIEQHPAWEMLSQIRMTLRAEVPLNRFCVRDLLALTVGQVFESASPDTEDVPIRVGSAQLGWGEFEVIEQQMALRVTRLD